MWEEGGRERGGVEDVREGGGPDEGLEKREGTKGGKRGRGGIKGTEPRGGWGRKGEGELLENGEPWGAGWLLKPGTYGLLGLGALQNTRGACIRWGDVRRYYRFIVICKAGSGAWGGMWPVGFSEKDQLNSSLQPPGCAYSCPAFTFGSFASCHLHHATRACCH